MTQLKQAEREFNLPSPFCSMHTPSGLGETHPNWEKQSVLLSLLIQVLISFLEMPSHTHPEVIFNQIDWHLMIQLTCTMNHHHN